MSAVSLSACSVVLSASCPCCPSLHGCAALPLLAIARLLRVLLLSAVMPASLGFFFLSRCALALSSFLPSPASVRNSYPPTLTHTPISGGRSHRVFGVPLEEVKAAEGALVPLPLLCLCRFVLRHGKRAHAAVFSRRAAPQRSAKRPGRAGATLL